MGDYEANLRRSNFLHKTNYSDDNEPLPVLVKQYIQYYNF